MAEAKNEEQEKPDGVLEFAPSEKSEHGEETIEINYEATMEDEEKFMLMLAMHMQPSEVDALDPDRRRWLLARLELQREMAREQMQRQALMANINAPGGPKGDGLFVP